MAQKYYKMNIAGLDRNLPICPLNESLQIAGFVIFGDPELTTACAAALLERAPEYDYMISAEAKGIPLVHEMARLAGNQKYFLARKSPKLYMTGVFEASLRSITTERDQKLYLDTADAELHTWQGFRIYLLLLKILPMKKQLYEWLTLIYSVRKFCRPKRRGRTV